MCMRTPWGATWGQTWSSRVNQTSGVIVEDIEDVVLTRARPSGTGQRESPLPTVAADQSGKCRAEQMGVSSAPWHAWAYSLVHGAPATPDFHRAKRHIPRGRFRPSAHGPLTLSSLAQNIVLSRIPSSCSRCAEDTTVYPHDIIHDARIPGCVKCSPEYRVEVVEGFTGGVPRPSPQGAIRPSRQLLVEATMWSMVVQIDRNNVQLAL